MKALLLSLALGAACTAASGQSFLGLYGTDNSVTQVRDNPAFVVMDDRAQLNFFAAGAQVGGNALLFKKGIYGFINDGKATMNTDYIRSYDQRAKTMWGNLEIMGPGATFRVKKKYFFGITTGMRYMVNVDNLNDKFFRMMGNNPIKDSIMLDSFSINNFSMNAQVFSEINFSYAGFFYETEDYKLIGGASVKLLNGIGAAGMGISNATFKTYNNDGVAYDIRGTANVAFSPYANKWAITNNPFRALGSPANNLGVGLDLGMVYYMDPNETMQLRRGYITRFAASITDIGSINYSASSTSGAYSISGKSINYRATSNNPDVTFGNRIFNDYLKDTIAKPTSSLKKIKMGLPTALHLNADMKVENKFWVNVNALVNLRKPSADKYATHYISTLTITPRYMLRRDIGISLPFSFNTQRQGYLGAILHLGPVFIGSGSFMQMTLSNTITNINMFMGANMRVKFKKQRVRDMMMI